VITMLVDIIEVKALPKSRLFLKFKDGTEGTIDISKHVQFTGVFENLKDDMYFKKVKVNSELGTICWPNGADLDPDMLYALLRGEPVPNL
jgi:hypothetical protein